MALRRTVRAKTLRQLRRMARLVVLLVALMSVFGGATALAAEAYARFASAHRCCCPHSESERAACPCCNNDASRGGCLPAHASASASMAPAPAVADATLVPIPPLVGIVAMPEIARLEGRVSPIRLERPPRV